MSVFKGLFVALTSCALLPQAFAEVTSQVTAKEPSQVKVHSTLRVSHTMDRFENDKKEMHTKPFLHVRPQLGLKLTDPGVDFEVVGYFYKNTNTTVMETTRALEVYATFEEITLGALSVNPFLIYFTPFEKDPARTVAASFQSLSTSDMSLGFGTLKATAALEVGGTVTSREEKVTYQKKANPSLGLESTTFEGAKKDSDFYHEASVSVDLKLAAVEGLKLTVENFLTTPYEAQYTIDENGKETSKYLTKQESTQRVRLSYALTDRMSVRNDLYTFQRGFFAQSTATGKKELRNELQLIYSM